MPSVPEPPPLLAPLLRTAVAAKHGPSGACDEACFVALVEKARLTSQGSDRLPWSVRGLTSERTLLVPLVLPTKVGVLPKGHARRSVAHAALGLACAPAQGQVSVYRSSQDQDHSRMCIFGAVHMCPPHRWCMRPPSWPGPGWMPTAMANWTWRNWVP